MKKNGFCFAFVAMILINGTNYVPVEAVASGKGLQTRWDAFLKNMVVQGRFDSVKFHVGSDYGLSRGRLVKLEDKVRLFNGQVVVPASAAVYVDRLTVQPSAPAAPPPVTRVISQTLYGKPEIIPETGYRIRRVAIDAGHGGKDYGAISPHGTREKDLALEMAQSLRRELELKGIDVVMTRNSDVFIPLDRRAEIANKKNVDFFVSIHANASVRRSLQGFEIYYLSEATDDAALALERAENSVLKLENSASADPDSHLKTIYWDLKETENRKESIHIADDVADAVESSVEISHRRIKAANFYVLKWTECPAVLLELGYITNPADERRLKNSLYRQRLVEGIVKGILNYKDAFEKSDGFTQ